VDGLTNAGSFLTGSISPGEIITLFGTGIGPAAQAVLALDTTGKVSTIIGGVQVSVNGFNCPMIFASATQVSAVVPYEIAGFASADVLVKYLGLSSNAIHVNGTTAPGCLRRTDRVRGRGDPEQQQFGELSNNWPKGIVVIYLTGEGQTSRRGDR
jgi:uncharacterized protein (TIGR03437 family)